MKEDLKIERSSRGLSEAMFEELDNLRTGKSTPQQAMAKASIAKALIATLRIELDVARFVVDGQLDGIAGVEMGTGKQLKLVKMA